MQELKNNTKIEVVEKLIENLYRENRGIYRFSQGRTAHTVVANVKIENLKLPENAKRYGTNLLLNLDGKIIFITYVTLSLPEVIEAELKKLNKDLYFKYNNLDDYFETSSIQDLKLSKDISLTNIKMGLYLEVTSPKIKTPSLFPLIKVK